MPTTLAKGRLYARLAADLEWTAPEDPLIRRYRDLSHYYMQRHLEGDLYDPPF